ncbi:hypothetical protein LX36DRAFT_660819, partial [Colletotrichum falcatum]
MSTISSVVHMVQMHGSAFHIVGCMQPISGLVIRSIFFFPPCHHQTCNSGATQTVKGITLGSSDLQRGVADELYRCRDAFIASGSLGVTRRVRISTRAFWPSHTKIVEPFPRVYFNPKSDPTTMDGIVCRCRVKPMPRLSTAEETTTTTTTTFHSLPH